MRLTFSKNARPRRASSFRFQYQPSVRYMPCVVFRPSEWMSLMNISRPASFIVLVTPNSLAALIELMVSPPALARPRICALPDACACSRKDEKSEVQRVLDGAHHLPPAALTTAGGVASSAMRAEGVVGGQEEPGLAAGLLTTALPPCPWPAPRCRRPSARCTGCTARWSGADVAPPIAMKTFFFSAATLAIASATELVPPISVHAPAVSNHSRGLGGSDVGLVLVVGRHHLDSCR